MPAALRLASRIKIVGWEFVFLGALLVALVALQLGESGGSPTVESFAWVYGIVGVTSLLVGLETVSLARQVPVLPEAEGHDAKV